jgi:hypothetical protein
MSAHSQLEDRECIATMDHFGLASPMHSMQFLNRSNGLQCFVRFLAVFIALSGRPVWASRDQEARPEGLRGSLYLNVCDVCRCGGMR